MNAIVAVNSDWGIGLDGSQVVVIPEDRRRFRRLTDGGVVIVGRKTFEHLPGPLPNRKSIVLTQDSTFKAKGVVIVHSVDEVLEEVADEDPEKVFVIGGGEIFELLLPLCAYAYVTKIDINLPSDTFFPDLDILPGWSFVRREFGTYLKADVELQTNYSYGNADDESDVIRYSFDLYKRQGRLTLHNDSVIIPPDTLSHQ